MWSTVTAVAHIIYRKSFCTTSQNNCLLIFLFYKSTLLPVIDFLTCTDLKVHTLLIFVWIAFLD